jgi:hypothetical protein
VITFRIEGIDTNDINLVNQIVNGILNVYPVCQQWGYTTTETTLDMYIETE